MRQNLRYAAPSALLAATLAFAACSSESKRSGFGEEDDAGVTGVPGFVDGQVPCAGLECKRVACGGGVTTTLTGKVYDPAGANPLYNVQVYIPGGPDPDGELPPMKSSLTDGIACETCNSVVLSPLASAITDGHGEFTLENVPVDKDVPIVIQVGKWRRKVHVDIQDKCEENKAPDKTLTLPKNGSEGDLPHMAVAAGSNDALECLLRGVGLSDSEFVMGASDAGHVHMYKGSGGKMGVSADTDLWNDEAKLKQFDMVLLNCEGSEHLENKGGSTPGARASMYEYLNAGGRVFGTHYQHVWFSQSPQDEFKQLAVWADEYPPNGVFDVNTSFPKGEKLADWLLETGASSTLGKIDLKNVRGSVEELREPGLGWIVKNGSPGAKFFTVNTPIAAPVEQQCGRGVFSDLHITDASGPASIGSCPISAGGLNGQQKVLEFILFDLSSCVQDDKIPPAPPK